jgi:hypothetical protein
MGIDEVDLIYIVQVWCQRLNVKKSSNVISGYKKKGNFLAKIDCQILKANYALCSYKVISVYFVAKSKWKLPIEVWTLFPLNSRFTHEVLLTLITWL